MESRKILRSAGVVGALTMMSRVFGVARDMTLAVFFGTSFAMSAFVVAFRVPNLFRSLFGEGALSSAFIPVFTTALKRDGHERAFEFAGRMLAVLFVVLGSISVLGVAGVSVWIRFLPQNSGTMLTLRLLRIMLPYLVFICSTALLAAILNSLGHFTAPAAAQMVLNIVIVVAAWTVFPLVGDNADLRITVVAWSVVVAGILQMLVQFPAMFKRGFMPFPLRIGRDPYILRVVSLMSISSIGMGVTRINVLIDGMLAMALGPGAASYLYFAERLVYLPVGVFATALGTVLLPVFSGYAASKDVARIRSGVGRGIRQLGFIMIPSAAGLFVLARPVVALVYERGDFDILSTDMTSIALICYAPGLIFFGTIKVLVSAFYALQDMKTPLKTGLFCTALNIGLSATLMWPLGHGGIAFATVIASGFNAVLLALAFQKKAGSPGWWRVLLSLARSSFASAVMAVATVLVYNAVSAGMAPYSNLSSGLTSVGVSVCAGVVVYISVAFIIRCDELRELLGR